MSKSKAIKSKPSRLGRGLSSLMAGPVTVSDEESGGVETPSPIGSQHAVAADSDGPRMLRVMTEEIVPNPTQPRQRFDNAALDALAESIRRDGVMQPVLVRRAAAGGYELIAGERRWRAAQRAELKTLPAIVRDLDDQASAEWALVENLQREDLNPIERAMAFARLSAMFGMTHDQVAERVGLERSSVTNHLRLLRLSEPVRDMVSAGTLGMGHARALAGLEDAEAQRRLAESTVREGWSVRKVETMVKQAVSEGGRPARNLPGRPAYLQDLERQITDQLGTKARLKTGRKKGTGSLSIDFYSIEQFDELLAKLGVTPE
ncbi:MAG: ParB/RepB/Spo0J family partition protein [Planctomycetota bacterium]